jgi:hypothetical protein
MATIIVNSTPMYSTKDEITYTYNQSSTYVDDQDSCWAMHAQIDDEDDIMALQARGSSRTKDGVQATPFDTDSYPIGIDSFASICMTPYKEDFVEGTLTPMKHQRTITPFGKGAPISVSMRGTIRWSIEDNDGTQHELDIPNSMYVPDGNMRLLSPQHWAAASTERTPTSADRDKFSSQQFWNRNILRWGEEGEYTRTVYNNKRSNVPIIYSSPSSQHYSAYQATVRKTIQQHYCTKFMCNEATMVSDDDGSQASLRTTSNESITPIQQRDQTHIEQINDAFTQLPSDIPTIIPRDLPTVITDDEELVTGADDASELMRWHYRLGHLSFKKMHTLAMKGLIPKKLSKVRPPKCACCIYGNMNRRPWRTKGQKQRAIRTASKPGECVSVDQMESTAVGFVGQLKG